MKKVIRKIAAVITILLMTSCASTTFLSIDVMQPARVNFSKNIVNVAVIDNAGRELSDSIPDSTNSELEIITSMSKKIFKHSLIQFINEETYFNEVILYPHEVRTDKNYGMQLPLIKSDIEQIASQVDADAVISIDAFEIKSSEVMGNFDGFLYTAAQGNMAILFRICDAKGNNIAPIMLSEDSIRWIGDRGTQFYDTENYERLALMMSENMVKQLIPHWESQERWYYTDGTKLMKEATKHAKVANWSEAAKSWGAAFEAAKEDKQKAKIASNIAFANESLDDIANAVIWIRIASNLIEGNKRSDEYGYINWYKVKLLERERDTPKVLEQIGIEVIEE